MFEDKNAAAKVALLFWTFAMVDDGVAMVAGTNMTAVGSGARLRKGVAALSIAACLITPGPVLAGDLGDFFANQFGFGGGHPQQASIPSWSYPDDEDRPLVVRPHRRKTAPRLRASEVTRGPTVPVSIYEDRTLRRGDAVMTSQGIRIFRGSDTLPYRETDFVAVSDAGNLPRTVEKALTAIDQVPRT